MLNLIVIFSFVFIVFTLNSIYLAASSNRRLAKLQLAQVVQSTSLTESTTSLPVSTQRGFKILGNLASVFSRIMGPKFMSRLGNNLINAGIALRPEEFILLDTITALLFLVLSSVFVPSRIVSIIAGLAGLWLPFLVIALLKKNRLIKFEAQLLDGLVLLANGLRSGLSLMQAWGVAAREIEPPLSDEFKKVIRENSLGVGVKESLQNMSERVQSKDVELVISGILIQREIGGNLAEVLDSIAYTIEQRIKMRGKIKVLTAQGRISGVIVSLLPILLGAFIFTFYPEFGEVLLTDPIGKMMLVGAAVSLLIGIYIVHKVVTFDD